MKKNQSLALPLAISTVALAFHAPTSAAPVDESDTPAGQYVSVGTPTEGDAQSDAVAVGLFNDGNVEGGFLSVGVGNGGHVSNDLYAVGVANQGNVQGDSASTGLSNDGNVGDRRGNAAALGLLNKGDVKAERAAVGVMSGSVEAFELSAGIANDGQTGSDGSQNAIGALNEGERVSGDCASVAVFTRGNAYSDEANCAPPVNVATSGSNPLANTAFNVVYNQVIAQAAFYGSSAPLLAATTVREQAANPPVGGGEQPDPAAEAQAAVNTLMENLPDDGGDPGNPGDPGQPPNPAQEVEDRLAEAGGAVDGATGVALRAIGSVAAVDDVCTIESESLNFDFDQSDNGISAVTGLSLRCGTDSDDRAVYLSTSDVADPASEGTDNVSGSIGDEPAEFALEYEQAAGSFQTIAQNQVTSISGGATQTVNMRSTYNRNTYTQGGTAEFDDGSALYVYFE